MKNHNTPYQRKASKGISTIHHCNYNIENHNIMKKGCLHPKAFQVGDVEVSHPLFLSKSRVTLGLLKAGAVSSLVGNSEKFISLHVMYSVRPWSNDLIFHSIFYSTKIRGKDRAVWPPC